MKYTILAALVIGMSLNASAQTKMIAHRSHSGSDATFNLNGLDNFGYVPQLHEELKVQPDSSKTKAKEEKTLKTEEKSRKEKRIEKKAAKKEKKAVQ